MVAFTVNSSVNFDDSSFATRVGDADTYTLGTNVRLTVDTDTRYCANSTPASGNLGATVYATSPGSELYFDGSKIRIIPFVSGAGNVPAIGTTITEGGASSYFLGVWPAFNVPPQTVGTAMSASGYIKVKNVTGSYSVGALTGITASASGADTVGWIEVIGSESRTIQVNRSGSWTARGEWFEHSSLVTTGLSGSTYQLPASLDNTYYAGVWVETAVSSSIYDLYPCMGTTSGSGVVATDELRGRVCWISSRGVVRLGYDGTYTNGYTPPAGRRIRVPNIVTINCTAAAPTVNAVPNATPGTRYETLTSTAGSISLDKINIAWDINSTAAYAVSITNTAILDYMLVQGAQTRVTLTNMGVGQSAALNLLPGLNYLPLGADLIDCVWTKTATAYAISINGVDDLTVIRGRAFLLTGKLGAYAYYYSKRATFTNTTHGGGYCLMNCCSDVTFTNTTYFDALNGMTIATGGTYAWQADLMCENVVVDGLSFGGLVGTQPYLGVFRASNSRNIYLRNLGSPTVPLDFGTPRKDDVGWTRVTTTATVTSVAHGMATGDIIAVMISSDVTVITLTVKSTGITVTGLDTFTFTCLDAGAASGTLSYSKVVTAILGYNVSSVAGCTNCCIQNCYVTNLRSLPISYVANSSWDGIFTNVQSDAWSFLTVVMSAKNQIVKGLKNISTITGTAGVFGVHWADAYIGELSINKVSQPWTRVTTICTVTSSNHNLLSADTISVLSSSDASAVVIGGQDGQKTVTVSDSSHFTFTCANAGSTSGTITYENISGRVTLYQHEPSVESSAYFSIDAGAPTFNGNGTVNLFTVGDQVTWECPWYIIGHTSFPNVLPLVTNVNRGFWYYWDFTYQIDRNDGTGWSAWKNLYVCRSNASMTIGQYTVTMDSTTGLAVGDYVQAHNAATYIGVNAKIVTIDSPTQITLNVANIANGTGIRLAFRQYPNETLDAERGFKLKIRILTAATNTTGLTGCSLLTTSTSASRRYQYPLDGDVTKSTIWAPSVGDVVTLTPSGSSSTYRANVIDSKFPVQDPISSSLSRYEYLVQYDDSPEIVPSPVPWHQMWTTVSGYLPIFSALPFISSSAGNPSSGSIVRR